MDMVLQHGHGQELEKWTCSMNEDTQQGHRHAAWAWTFSMGMDMEMQHGNHERATLKCNMDKDVTHGNAAWT
jgi:hypothetical protein